MTIIFLNANKNRFKLLTDEQAKSEFLSLDTPEKWKEKNLNFAQVINFVWSDNECYQFARKLTDANANTTIEKMYDKLDKIESLESPDNQIQSNQLIKDELEYTSLIAQLFKECNILERLMNKFKLIINEKDTRKAIPTHKSNLIDIADTINDYLNKYEQLKGTLPEELKETNFFDLKDEWQRFSINELSIVKNKILDVEQNIKNKQNVENSIKKFIFRNKIKPLEFDISYSAKDYEFSMNLFETRFDQDVKEKINPEMPDISTTIDQNTELLNKFRNEFDFYIKKYGLDESNDDLDDEKEMKSTSGYLEQFSVTSDQMNNLTDRDNIFQPLASSSNISNELNIEMDIEDCTFCSNFYVIYFFLF